MPPAPRRPLKTPAPGVLVAISRALLCYIITII